MTINPVVLEAHQLVVEYVTDSGRVRALDGASISVRQGEVHAIVGESGSGKTTLGMAAGRLLASNAEFVSGSLVVTDVSVPTVGMEGLRALRRDRLGFVFQNPIASLDPTMRIGAQMQLAQEGRDSTFSMRDSLERVGLRGIDTVLRSFPHELSGGMAQRVCIAMALMRGARVLIADEPTAAVDATLRPQILKLLVDLCRETGSALVLLTHDLHAVGEFSTRVSVMHAGKVVESGDTQLVLANPQHPYTRSLLSARLGLESCGQRLEAVRYVA